VKFWNSVCSNGWYCFYAYVYSTCFIETLHIFCAITNENMHIYSFGSFDPEWVENQDENVVFSRVHDYWSRALPLW
jgi:hypothetical protein